MAPSSLGHNRAKQLTKDGIAAYRAGQRQQALSCFVAATQADRSYDVAWLWLAELVEASEDKRVCLEQILEADPFHSQARALLKCLETTYRQGSLFQSAAQPLPGQPSGQAPSQPTLLAGWGTQRLRQRFPLLDAYLIQALMLGLMLLLIVGCVAGNPRVAMTIGGAIFMLLVISVVKS